jgi:hypothetical protein
VAKGKSNSEDSTPLPELPAWKAFVVQLTNETSAESDVFAGRVEHLSSGRRMRFNSQEEFLAALTQMLADATCKRPPT